MDNTRLSSPITRRPSHLLLTLKELQLQTNQHLYTSGSRVKVAFYQKPYILKDGVTYGTSLKLVGVQVVSLSSAAGTDSGDLNSEQVAELFGNTKGYKTSEPNVVPAAMNRGLTF